MIDADIMENTQEKFEVLTGRMQLLKRPTMWIGAVNPVRQKTFVVSEDGIERKDVEYVPAFRKIMDEILDNSLDALIEHRNSEGVIHVDIGDYVVEIEDNGPGMPVEKKKLSESELKNLPADEAKRLQNSYIPLIAWTRLFSGTNFRDSADKKNLGSHGVGSTATVIFSKKFTGETRDGKHSCVVTATDNMEHVTCKAIACRNKSGTKVVFEPDLKRFGLDKIEQVYKDVMRQRLMCLAVSFPKIKFSFNGEAIKPDAKKFLRLFSEHIEFADFGKGFVGVYPSDSDEFEFFTYVNGLHMSRGGKHIEWLDRMITSPIRDKLVKKYKAIKPADIRNRLGMVVFMRDFPNAKFDSQTKDTLTNPESEISAYIDGGIDFDKLVKAILKNDAIIEPIVDMFKLKEELKARKELKGVKKAKVKSDKYFPGVGDKKYLFLCEGLSAGSSLLKCLGRDGKYYYCLRGLAINAYSQSIQKISANQELKDVLNILEFDASRKGEEQEPAFEKIVIATDADLDGINITSMLLGWWKKFAPGWFGAGRICKLNTPVVILKDQKDQVKKWFFTLDEFRKWEAENKSSNVKIVYLKGLGSIPSADLEYIIAHTQDGFDGLLEEYNLDADSDRMFEDWLGNDAEPRKEYLRNYNLDLDLA